MFPFIDANSVHSPINGRSWTSVIDVLDGTLGDSVHLLWSFSKDFAVAGWRVGAVMTHNKQVRKVFSSLGHQCEASRCALATLTAVLRQEQAVAEYLGCRRSALAAAHAAASNALASAGIRHKPSEAGLFVLLDFREYADSAAEEQKLWKRVLEKGNLNLTPGSNLGITTAGFFRLCFAYNEVATTVVAIQRLASVLANYSYGNKRESVVSSPSSNVDDVRNNIKKKDAAGVADWSLMEAKAIPTKDALHTVFRMCFIGIGSLRHRKPSPSCLDLGCGDGRIAASIAALGIDVWGVDCNAEAIWLANAKKSEFSTASCFTVGDCTQTILERTFDVVLCQLVISIVGAPHDRLRLLQNAASHLSSGGLLLLSASGVSDDINEGYKALYEKDARAIGENFSYFSRDADGKIIYRTHHFTSDSLCSLISTAGFELQHFVTEIETSSRRKSEPARFFYAVASKI